MLADAGALGGAMWVISLAERPSGGAWSYGLKRAEILAAAANGVTLLGVGVLVLTAAIGRLIHPPPVEGLPLVLVAGLGIVVNLLASVAISRANRRSLNIERTLTHDC